MSCKVSGRAANGERATVCGQHGVKGLQQFRTARFLRQRPFIGVVAAAALVAALVGTWQQAGTSGTILPGLAETAEATLESPPLPPPLLFRRMTPERAILFNAGLPFTGLPNLPANPFKLDPRSADYSRSLDCLTTAIYYEASGEGPPGEAAVAQVVLNRVRHPAFPASVCAVVYQGSTRPTGCQFSFTCDGSLLREPDQRGWQAAQLVAATALSGAVFRPAGLATHYHTESVVPYWASSLAKNAQLGAHIFYRWAGAWGRPAAFRQRYSGERWDEAQLRNASLVAHGNVPQLDGPVEVVVKTDFAEPDPLLVISQLASLPPKPGDPAAVDAYRSFLADHANADLQTPVAPLPTVSSGASDPAGDKLRQLVQQFASSPAYAAVVKERPGSLADRKKFAVALALVLNDIEAYTGVPVGTAVVSVGPVFAGALPGVPRCGTESAASQRRRARRGQLALRKAQQDPLGQRLAQAAADYLWTARARATNSESVPANCSSAVDQQIVAAVLSRMIYLRSGEVAARRQVAWEAHQGRELVPWFADRLKLFEQNRDRFVTLGQAYPVLLARLPAARVQQSAPTTAQGNPTSSDAANAAPLP